MDKEKFINFLKIKIDEYKNTDYLSEKEKKDLCGVFEDLLYIIKDGYFDILDYKTLDLGIYK